jgi:hypothetical protein
VAAIAAKGYAPSDEKLSFPFFLCGPGSAACEHALSMHAVVMIVVATSSPILSLSISLSFSLFPPLSLSVGRHLMDAQSCGKRTEKRRSTVNLGRNVVESGRERKRERER